MINNNKEPKHMRLRLIGLRIENDAEYFNWMVEEEKLDKARTHLLEIEEECSKAKNEITRIQETGKTK